jgi:mannose/cellobiose epimerase-like protein (N-acyl-D-glucosamine 2-epimerase family)
MNKIDFTFSDTVYGIITGTKEGQGYEVSTIDGRKISFRLTPSVYARYVQNLNEGWQDAGGDMKRLLRTAGVPVFLYGTYYPTDADPIYDVQWMVFPAKDPDTWRQEEPDWWINQARSIADKYLEWQFNFPKESIDFKKYRTNISLDGIKKNNDIQETDTISRLVYGLASTYMLTGDDRFLEAAERGTKYLQDELRVVDTKRGFTYWCHAKHADGEQVLTSLFGDDFGAIPAYEQIYALAGPTQTYRITGDPSILVDIDGTLELFEKVYKDNAKEGYFSHLEPNTFDPKAASLGQNSGRKNWNSVGDHAPAFLINAYLATGSKRYGDMLEYCFDLITKYFPDDANSPFVQEKFMEDWSADRTWGWQQNRGVVGHNLKISWNLMRMYSLRAKPEYKALAEKIGRVMPTVGQDRQRAGWYDVVERVEKLNGKHQQFVWHDRKAWWQQEQGILAYLILNGMTGDKENLDHARSSAAFYSAFFLDTDDGAVYFNTLANGLPYLMGTERNKGSHSMSGYHSLELCFLAATYTNLLVRKQPLTLYFAPVPNNLPGGLLRVSPDILPPGSVSIESCTIDGKAHTDFDQALLAVKMPAGAHRMKVKVTLKPKA